MARYQPYDEWVVTVRVKPLNMEDVMAKKRRKKKEAPPVAALRIKGVGKMSTRERKNVINWLYKQAEHIVKFGPEYTSGVYTAGLRYE